MTLINRNVHWSLIKDTEGGSYQRNLTADTLCIIKAITLGLQLAGRPSFCIRWGMSETLAAFRRTEGSWLYPVEMVVESYLPQLSHNLGRMKTGLSNLVPRQVITTKKTTMGQTWGGKHPEAPTASTATWSCCRDGNGAALLSDNKLVNDHSLLKRQDKACFGWRTPVDLPDGANTCTFMSTSSCSCGLRPCESETVAPAGFPGDPSPHASVCSANCPADSWKTVDFDVFGQVVAAGKLLLAHLTLVRFDTRVGPPVSGQLVRSGKPERRSFGLSKGKPEKKQGHTAWTGVKNFLILPSAKS